MSGYRPLTRKASTEWLLSNPANDLVRSLVRRDPEGTFHLCVDVACKLLVAVHAANLDLPITSTPSAVRLQSLRNHGDERRALPSDNAILWHCRCAAWAVLYAQFGSPERADAAYSRENGVAFPYFKGTDGAMRLRVTDSLSISSRGVKILSNGTVTDNNVQGMTKTRTIESCTRRGNTIKTGSGDGHCNCKKGGCKSRKSMGKCKCASKLHECTVLCACKQECNNNKGKQS